MADKSFKPGAGGGAAPAWSAVPWMVEGQGDMAGSFSANPNISADTIADLLKGASVPGFSGPLAGGGSGDMTFTGATPELMKYLQDNGYNFQQRYLQGGSDGGLVEAGLFGKDGSVLGQTKQYSVPSAGGDLAAIASILGTWAGAGGLSDVMNLGAGAAPQIGNGAFLGEGALSGVPGWDAAAGMFEIPAFTGSGTLVAGDGMGLAELVEMGAINPGTAAAGGGGAADIFAGMGGGDIASILGGGGSAGNLAPVVDALAGVTLPAATQSPLTLESILGLGKAAAGNLKAGDWAQLISSGLGWLQGNKLKGAAGQIDPFGKYRSGYAKQLAELMTNPSSVTSLPGYKESMTAAEQALTRNLAAQGLTGSGAAAEALAKFGGQFQAQFFADQFARLAGLAGANFNNAGTATQATAAGYNTQNRSIENLMKILPMLIGG